MSRSLEELAKIMEVKFILRQSTFSGILAEEKRLRSELRRVDEMTAEANETGYDQLKAIGADVIWKSWIGKTKSELNRELALVLARKDKMLGSVRRDFGRLLVSEALVSADSKRLQKEKRDRLLSSAINLHNQKK